MFSNEAVRLFADKSIDTIYIDANHSYDAVYADLNMWYPKIRGTISGHDLPWESVRKAVEQFCRDKNLAYQPIERESWRIDL